MHCSQVEGKHRSEKDISEVELWGFGFVCLPVCFVVLVDDDDDVFIYLGKKKT